MTKWPSPTHGTERAFLAMWKKAQGPFAQSEALAFLLGAIAAASDPHAGQTFARFAREVLEAGNTRPTHPKVGAEVRA